PWVADRVLLRHACEPVTVACNKSRMLAFSGRNGDDNGCMWASALTRRASLRVCGVLTFAAIIALAGCAHAPPAMGMAPPPEAHLIPDRALLIGIADRAQTIRDTSQPTSAKGLAAQLDREH